VRLPFVFALAGCWTQQAPSAPEPQHELLQTSCATFRHAMRGVLARVLDRFKEEAQEAPRTLVGFCAATPHGRWQIELPAIDIADVRSREEAIVAIETRYEVVHVALDGQRAHYAPKQRLSGYGGRAPQKPVVYDFDGDGEPELYVAVDEAGPEGHLQHEVMLLHWDGKRIAPYAAAKDLDIASVTDLDGDHRPDLQIWDGYSDPLEGCQSSFPYDWPDPLFVAHAQREGTFSDADLVARKYVRGWCPRPPSKIASSQDALCARLWVVTPSDVIAARALVTASCVPGYCERELAGTPQPAGASEDCERRLSWFERNPPFALP
jgi:hypothetical protein